MANRLDGHVAVGTDRRASEVAPARDGVEERFTVGESEAAHPARIARPFPREVGFGPARCVGSIELGAEMPGSVSERGVYLSLNGSASKRQSEKKRERENPRR